jgi:DSF synthase
VVYANYSAYDLPLTTISVVQGDALGGGFEAALSSDVVIAEQRARFGFPEILFNLFPGMGAYSFISRRVQRQATTVDVISSGDVRPAEAMYKLGLVDRLVEDGAGEKEAAIVIRQSGAAHEALFRVRRRRENLKRSELQDVVEVWAKTALGITERDLRLMQALVKRQDKLGSRAQTQRGGSGDT